MCVYIECIKNWEKNVAFASNIIVWGNLDEEQALFYYILISIGSREKVFGVQLSGKHLFFKNFRKQCISFSKEK